MNKPALTLVGGGQMGQALVAGMLQNDVITPDQLSVVDPSEAIQQWWRDQHPQCSVGGEMAPAMKPADVALLAVKPNMVEQVARQEPALWTDKLVISVAAGIGISQLAEWIGHKRVVRVMPNTPCLVGKGACAFCVENDVTTADEQWVHAALSAVGLAVKIPESQMDAVTGLSGSGPAYICLVIEALADGGVLAGLPRPLAMQLATQTVMGTAEMVRQTGQHPGQLKDAVASPGGTTIAAIQVLENNGLRSALIGAVEASANKSKTMG